MRVVVDFERCKSNAVCMVIAPAVFEVGDDDDLRLLQETPPEALRDAVREAATHCPTGAIRVFDD